MEEIDTAHRVFVSYIDKSREYYRAQGYSNPYRWAYHTDVPFTRLSKPLSECSIGLVTTAELETGGTGGVTYAAPTDPPPARLNTQNRFWDKDATHTDDLDSYLPIHRLGELRDRGRIGALSHRFYGVPTEYSQRKTREIDAPQVRRFCQEDGVDAVLLVAL